MTARHFILTIAAVALIVAPITISAQMGPGPGDGNGPGGGWHRGHGSHGGGPDGFGPGDGRHQLGFFEHMLPRLAEDLGLSDGQLEQIQAIVDNARPEIERLGDLLEDNREAYRSAIGDPTVFDEDAFRAHAAEQHQLQTDLMVVVGKTKAEAFKVFTPEQLVQLEEMRGEFGKRTFRRGGGRSSGS